ncbi:hypothetical protein AVEN_130260-1 [Araneus ventricosus]|uniref:Integrase catalytic domain-containing protein n=1 Tax=Araneus ventricosus TaxID=182803 RepID=A0A4Y2FMX1_ARAVE|nr:hypothetical protein AVEN_130260-1 [Araneus ventricosus]
MLAYPGKKSRITTRLLTTQFPTDRKGWVIDCIRYKSINYGSPSVTLLLDFTTTKETHAASFVKNYKEFLSDGRTEFNNSQVKTLFASKGISNRISMPYTPEQNGAAERENRTTASTSVPDKSPYEVWFNKEKTRVGHLRILELSVTFILQNSREENGIQKGNRPCCLYNGAKKLMFLHCRSFAESLGQSHYPDSDEERSKGRTEVAEEVKLAVQKGYLVTKAGPYRGDPVPLPELAKNRPPPYVLHFR